MLVGGGDNGGDALFAAARLAGRGAAVTALTVSSRLHEAGAAAARRSGVVIRAAGDPATRACSPAADLVLDGMVGIGGSGGLRRRRARLADWSPARGRIAVDVPSGVDADTGAVPGAAVAAAATVTFGTLKPGLLMLPGRGVRGRVELVPIGLSLPRRPISSSSAPPTSARLLPDPGADSSKYTRGVLGITAGSDAYPGAAVLVYRRRAPRRRGLPAVRRPAHAAELVRQHFPDVVATETAPGDGAAVLAAGRVQAWVVGPGLGTDDASAAVVEAVLGADVPVLVDADGLTIVAKHRTGCTLGRARPADAAHSARGRIRPAGRRRPRRGQGSAGRGSAGPVRRAAAELACDRAAEGFDHARRRSDGEARVNGTGIGWLAAAGTGDVLSRRRRWTAGFRPLAA